jgi:uncharacterized membrane protein
MGGGYEIQNEKGGKNATRRINTCFEKQPTSFQIATKRRFFIIGNVLVFRQQLVGGVGAWLKLEQLDGWVGRACVVVVVVAILCTHPN